MSKIMAQSSFMQTYLENHRDEVGRYASLVQMEPVNFRYDKHVASSLSEVIVYSYCFAPYVDTAGIVMAKRIREEGVPVDVVCNTMAGVRDVDDRLDRITAGLIGRQITINGRPSFSSWPEIKHFADNAQKSVLKIEKSRKPIRLFIVGRCGSHHILQPCSIRFGSLTLSGELNFLIRFSGM